MASAFKRIFWALLTIAITATLVWFGNGLNPVWPLLWFAPLPVLLFALRNSGRSTFLVAIFSWLLGCLNLWHYFHTLQMPFAAWLAVFSIAALVFAAAVLLFRALVRRGALWSGLLAFPATWVVYEYLRNLITPHGTAGCLAYSQLKFLAFLQLASIAGPWGMSFLLLLFSAALAIGFHLRARQPKQAVRIVGVSIGVVALVLIFGVVRLALPSRSPQVKVGLIASDEPGNAGVAAPGAAAERLFRDYGSVAQKLAAQGAQVIVLPEKLGVIVNSDSRNSDAIFQRLADSAKAVIVVGVVDVSPPLKYNQARVYEPGAAVLTYDKHHMLPPFESNLTPGTRRMILREPSGVWGVAICKDMDFTPLSRQYGNAGVGLMLDPAWDFRIDRSWHGHIAMMRGVEDGFSIAHTAKDGFLTVSDDRGRILAQTRSDSAPFATLVAKVPVEHNATLYLLLGDWFPWFALVALLFAFVQLYRLRKTSSVGEDR